jgi:hypothetical protein
MTCVELMCLRGREWHALRRCRVMICPPGVARCRSNHSKAPAGNLLLCAAWTGEPSHSELRAAPNLPPPRPQDHARRRGETGGLRRQVKRAGCNDLLARGLFVQ